MSSPKFSFPKAGGKNTMLYVVIGAAVVIGAIYLYCKKYGCSMMQEGYISNPLSAIDRMKRTPVTYAYLGDGITTNPHYQADHGDRLVPLGDSYFNPYKREINPYVPPVRRQDVELINDEKLRKDMVEAGDMEWHRTLNNVVRPDMPSMPGYWPFEIDFVKPDGIEPLYSDEYHYNAFLGQK